MKIIVTDGEQRAALAAVRTLGRAGHRVYVCSDVDGCIAGASRYCTRARAVANPMRRPDEFLSQLLQLATDVDADVVVPVSEAALLAVLPHRDRFTATIPFGPLDAFQRICDKRQLLKSAQRYGIAVPAQTELCGREDARLLENLPYPLVLKPHRSVAGKNGARIHTTVRHASNAQQAITILAGMPASAFPVLAQQRVVGAGFGISVLIWDGRLRAAFAHRRIREKPPSGGVSVLRESIALDENLLDRSVALIKEFGWQGVAMVEFKTDERSGVDYLMEINARLWGSLQLSIDAGVDFPNLLVDAARGIQFHPIVHYRVGVRSRWEWGDVDHLLAAMSHTPARLAMPEGEPRNRLAKLREFLSGFARENVPEVFRRDDPRPFLRETANWFRRR